MESRSKGSFPFTSEELSANRQARLAWLEHDERRDLEDAEWTRRCDIQATAVRRGIPMLSQSLAMMEGTERHSLAQASMGTLSNLGEVMWSKLTLDAMLVPSSSHSRLSPQRFSFECAARQALHEEVESEFLQLHRRWKSTTVEVALTALPNEELRWRTTLEQCESDAWQELWHGTITPVLRIYLTSSRGTHSEYNYRAYIQALERRQRYAIAVYFVQLQIAWIEEWGRTNLEQKRQLDYEMICHAEKISYEETVDCSELSQCWAPILKDIADRKDLRRERHDQRAKKIAALGQLWNLEVARLRHCVLEEDSRDYVSRWKAQELKAIEEIQDLLVRQHADHFPTSTVAATADGLEDADIDNNGDGHTSRPHWARLALHFVSEAARLRRGIDSIPFNELAACRQRLMHFDEFVTRVEQHAESPFMIEGAQDDEGWQVGNQREGFDLPVNASDKHASSNSRSFSKLVTSQTTRDPVQRLEFESLQLDSSLRAESHARKARSDVVDSLLHSHSLSITMPDPNVKRWLLNGEGSPLEALPDLDEAAAWCSLTSRSTPAAAASGDAQELQSSSPLPGEAHGPTVQSTGSATSQQIHLKKSDGRFGGGRSSAADSRQWDLLNSNAASLYNWLRDVNPH